MLDESGLWKPSSNSDLLWAKRSGDDELCSDAMPNTTQVCTNAVGCSWSAGSWGGCSNSCGDGSKPLCGLQGPTVTSPIACSGGKPTTSQSCTGTVSCAWSAGAGATVPIAGSGSQTRSVVCPGPPGRSLTAYAAEVSLRQVRAARGPAPAIGPQVAGVGVTHRATAERRLVRLSAPAPEAMSPTASALAANRRHHRAATPKRVSSPTSHTAAAAVCVGHPIVPGASGHLRPAHLVMRKPLLALRATIR